MPKRVYYITWIDPETGFLKREEYDTNRAMRSRESELRRRGVTNITIGSFERE